MARCRGPESVMEQPALCGHERWMLSYSDLLTLLFSLFVVLFASAHLQPKAVIKAVAPPPPARGIDELARIQAQIQQHLAPAFVSGKIEATLESRGLVLQLRDASFFASGDDQIRAEAYQTIGEIAKVIAAVPNLVSIEGHSDAAAVHGSRFKDNWELSAARGVAVIRYLTKDLGLNPNRLSAAAYADTRPRSDNESAEGRAQNRRVDIVIHREADRGK